MSNNWITDNLDGGGTFLRPSGLLIALILLLLVMGCSNDQTFEDFFHKEMKNNVEEYPEEVNYSYSLIHQVQNIFQKDDAIAIFRENNHQGEQIFITYFKKENGKWNWKQTRGAEWESPHKWSAMDDIPYIYSGAISDSSIEEIYAGREKALIIDVEGNKRFWYANSSTKEVQVKFIRNDGSEEIVES
ncbi:hypothetical protein, partial [Cytobacillus praedii]|uniref:hypothetical protein n=1 Tax=Cytobacillus praedii TaxID=1742358 RepID=UPI002E1D28CB|nr:hypothetical protein [Cytobacillus praedii]